MFLKSGTFSLKFRVFFPDVLPAIGPISGRKVPLKPPSKCPRLAIPQVVPDYRSERRLALLEGRTSDAAKAAAESRKRQREWSQRKNAKAWQPRKRFRAASFEVLVGMDNVLRLGCGWESGLQELQVTSEMVEENQPMEWKHLSVCCDRGGDGWCALGYLERKLMLNITRLLDQSHDATNDIHLAMARSGMKTHVVLQQAVWNLVHGPWGQDTRFRQAVEAMTVVFELDSLVESPLWQRFAVRILDDLDWGHRAGEDGIQEILWAKCPEDSP